MKRLLIMLCIVAFLAALPLSHIAMAAPKGKVLICHLNAANDTVRDGFNPGTWYLGRMIEVAESAVEAHLAHGDMVFGGQYPKVLSEEDRALIEEVYGVSVPNANCYFYVPD